MTFCEHCVRRKVTQGTKNKIASVPHMDADRSYVPKDKSLLNSPFISEYIHLSCGGLPGQLVLCSVRVDEGLHAQVLPGQLGPLPSGTRNT